MLKQGRDFARANQSVKVRRGLQVLSVEDYYGFSLIFLVEDV